MYILIFVIVISLLAYYLLFKNLTPTDSVKIEIKNQTYQFEVAKTLAQKSLGLGNRDRLCQNCGMIFVYQTEFIYPFWMKNTLIPLDIIWIDKNGTVVDIIQAKPNDLSILTPKSKAQYIIELNKDTSTNLNLKIGDQIQVPQNL